MKILEGKFQVQRNRVQPRSNYITQVCTDIGVQTCSRFFSMVLRQGKQMQGEKEASGIIGTMLKNIKNSLGTEGIKCGDIKEDRN